MNSHNTSNSNRGDMQAMGRFWVIVGIDNQGQLTDVIGKRRYATREEAIASVGMVITSGSVSPAFFVMEANTCVRRQQPPLETIDLEEVSNVAIQIGQQGRQMQAGQTMEQTQAEPSKRHA